MSIEGRILVVDDESGIREVCKRLLADYGYRVSTANSGDDALCRLQTEEFDFVLTDMMMPGDLNGSDLLAAIKRKSPLTDVVIMTGCPTLETAIPTLKNGAYDYLSKPVDTSMLLSVVERCFEKRRLSEELNREKILRQELQAAYEELQKVEKMKEAFMSRLSHELRTPFISVFFALDQMESDAENSLQPLVKTLRSHISGVWKMVESMLLFADLKQNGVGSDRVPIDVKHLLQDVLHNYKGEAEQKGVSVSLSVEGEVESIDGDPQLLSTAFKHLFLNAVYFNTPGGAVHILLKEDQDNQLSVSFADTGVGIPSAKIPDIFDGFYQAAEYLTRQVGGLGLGLAIVRRIIESHGGSVTVLSQEGKGSTFKVLIPMSQRSVNHV